MDLSERFLRVDAAGTTIDPSIKLDGSWEVALTDSYLTLPESKARHHVLGRTYGKADLVMDGAQYDLYATCSLEMDGLQDLNARSGWIGYKYGNLPSKEPQSSQFDIWSYKINNEMRNHTSIIAIVDFFLNYFTDHPDARLTMGDIITKLNEQMQIQADEAIPSFLEQVFRKTGGEKYVGKKPYYQIPAFRLNSNLITLALPYYVRSFDMSPNLAKLFNMRIIKTYPPPLNLCKVFKRRLFQIESPLKGTYYMRSPDGQSGVEWMFGRQVYKIRDPTKEIHGIIEGGEVATERTLLIVVATNLIEGGLVGESVRPVLRVIEKRSSSSRGSRLDDAPF